MNKEIYFFIIIGLVAFIIMASLDMYWDTVETVEKEQTKQVCLNQGKSVLECKALSE